MEGGVEGGLGDRIDEDSQRIEGICFVEGSYRCT